MANKSFKFFWTTHKWVGIIAAVFVLNVSITGFLLLIKKRSAWIQPPTQKGEAPGDVRVSFDDILKAIQAVDEAEIDTWDDVDRLDVRPDKGVVKVRANNRWEVQVDLKTGEVLQTMYRRSDLIEQIHDGSFVHDTVHAYVMPAVAFGLVFLTGSGIFLWLEPKWRRRKRRLATTRQRSPEE